MLIWSSGFPKPVGGVGVSAVFREQDTLFDEVAEVAEGGFLAGASYSGPSGDGEVALYAVQEEVHNSALPVVDGDVCDALPEAGLFQCTLYGALRSG